MTTLEQTLSPIQINYDIWINQMHPYGVVRKSYYTITQDKNQAISELKQFLGERFDNQFYSFKILEE